MLTQALNKNSFFTALLNLMLCCSKMDIKQWSIEFRYLFYDPINRSNVYCVSWGYALCSCLKTLWNKTKTPLKSQTYCSQQCNINPVFDIFSLMLNTHNLMLYINIIFEENYTSFDKHILVIVFIYKMPASVSRLFSINLYETANFLFSFFLLRT